METSNLKKFAQFARRSLMEQISVKLKLVMAENSSARRESTQAIEKLDKAVRRHGEDQIVERVAYIWFNRFCALRFMDVNRYTRIGTVSPAEGQSQPEILAEAKMGHIDKKLANEKTRQQIFALLEGKAPSSDPQGEAYRMLLVGVCNQWHRSMPFLFQRIDDYTELLMPDDLLSSNSILAHTREAMTLEVCRDVEVIGWLYQFYISEKKDAVFEGLKKNKKITPENIPAATQLFTPHWIVKYLVENSLGRLWMLNRPNSRLVDRMEYYIRPDTSGVRDQGLGVSEKTGGKYGSEKLSGSDRLAEGDGCGGNGLSSDEGLPQRGTLRIDKSDSSGGSVNSVEHSGGSRSQLDSGIQKLPFDSAGLQSGSGNADTDRTTAALHISATSAGNTLPAKGNLQNAGSFEKGVRGQGLEVSGEDFSNPYSLTPNPSACTREEDYLRVDKPEDIKICDPACGSGHMLTYAFDLLYAIYEEEGYEPAEIPDKILTQNIYGIEIDERAGELAAFALTMKDRARQRRFFNKGIRPNICVLENIHFEESELKEYMDFVGRDLFTAPLQSTLRQFEEADNFGTLICPNITDVNWMIDRLEGKNVSGQLFLSQTHQKVLKVLQQVDYLCPKYHVVITNPPYMGNKGMNGRLSAWVKDKFPRSKSDLFAIFIERNLGLALNKGVVAMITMQSWMFLSSFEALRSWILRKYMLLLMAHLGARAFDSIGGDVVSTTAFVLENAYNPDYKGEYLRLVEGGSEGEKSSAILEAIRNPTCQWLYRASAADFSKIPGSPIAYWAPDSVISAFKNFKSLKAFAIPSQGMATTNNNLFLRQWYECEKDKFILPQAVNADTRRSGKWFACNKGGPFKKWYGNNAFVVNYENDGKTICDYIDNTPGVKVKSNGRVINRDKYFKVGTTWSTISSSKFSMRYTPPGFVFETKGAMCFPGSEKDSKYLTALGCSFVVNYLLKFISPTLDYHEGPIGRLPIPQINRDPSSRLADIAIDITRTDWNAYETSWDFTNLPMLMPDYCQLSIEATYRKLRFHWREIMSEMKRLEEENNRIFIEAYGLQDVLTPQVPVSEITLTCNPHYRYGNEKSEEELEALLLSDTMRELVSYSVGCMFGRYSLDKPGLVLANQGEAIEDYYRKIFNQKKHEPHEKKDKENFRDFRAFCDSCLFPADDDNVIPMLDGDWFTDDITERFKRFLRVTFGEKHYEENLQFVENSLNVKGKRNYTIRDYFLGEFYNDHVRRYKKRPIYWLFSSPKDSFNALIYMHRYRPDTVSIVLNDYLREFRTKLISHKNHLEAVSINTAATKSERTKAIKEIEKLKKIIDELDEWERDVLYPLATQRIEIDLDDGVKVNYPKFGDALKKVPGLSIKS